MIQQNTSIEILRLWCQKDGQNNSESTCQPFPEPRVGMFVWKTARAWCHQPLCDSEPLQRGRNKTKPETQIKGWESQLWTSCSFFCTCLSKVLQPCGHENQTSVWGWAKQEVLWNKLQKKRVGCPQCQFMACEAQNLCLSTGILCGVCSV